MKSISDQKTQESIDISCKEESAFLASSLQMFAQINYLEETHSN